MMLPKYGRDVRADLSVELRVEGVANDTRPSDRLQDYIHDLL
jgi:hypothetical protein